VGWPGPAAVHLGGPWCSVRRRGHGVAAATAGGGEQELGAMVLCGGGGSRPAVRPRFGPGGHQSGTSEPHWGLAPEFRCWLPPVLATHGYRSLDPSLLLEYSVREGRGGYSLLSCRGKLLDAQVMGLTGDSVMLATAWPAPRRCGWGVPLWHAHKE
jgi:hypothetical protein